MPPDSERQAEPLIGIVIVNWNNWDETRECLDSIARSRHRHYRTYIVDNASTDNSGKTHIVFDDRTILIQSDSNRGWSGGNNLGIRAALDDGCDYVYLLNADAMVAPDTLSALAAAGANLPDAAVLGSLVVSQADPEWLEFAGTTIDAGNGHPVQTSCRRRDAKFASAVFATPAVKGCSFLMTRQGIARVGLLNEDYFLNYDETDWCFAALAAGMGVYCVANTFVLHKGATSMGGTTTPIYRYFTTRNRLLFAARRLDGKARAFAWRCALWEIKNALLGGREATLSARQRFWLLASVLLAIRDYALGRLGDCPAYVRTITRRFKASRAAPQ